jgi:hypothetical protein
MVRLLMPEMILKTNLSNCIKQRGHVQKPNGRYGMGFVKIKKKINIEGT